MSDGQRLDVELRKLKVSVAIIKKQMNNAWWPEAGCWAQETQGPSSHY